MKAIDERIKNFRPDMDIILKDITPSESLKKKVFTDYVKSKANKKHRRITTLVASFACVLLLFGIFQMPSARAHVISTLSEILTWVRGTTNIPVYLPDSWQPVQQVSDANVQNYYYKMQGNDNYYSINIYRTKVPVKFNDENDLLEKNGPVSEADFVGSISGEVITDETPELSIAIPTDAESIDLISGVKAYSENEGTSLWWTENGWSFEFIGSSLSLDTLKDLASAWNISDTQIQPSGKVSIIEGNKLTFAYMWDKEEFQYTFTTNSTDFSKTINILDSFNSINIGE